LQISVCLCHCQKTHSFPPRRSSDLIGIRNILELFPEFCRIFFIKWHIVHEAILKASVINEKKIQNEIHDRDLQKHIRRSAKHKRQQSTKISSTCFYLLFDEVRFSNEIPHKIIDGID